MEKAKKAYQVLIAEDDTVVAMVLKTQLRLAGYYVAGHASNGQEAVELATTENPDVILMDIQMPEVDGLEATRLIQEKCPCPVVLLSSHEEEEFIERASLAGAEAYLIKPPSTKELQRTICIAMARFADRQALRQLNTEYQKALADVKTLSGLVPICSSCKKIRDDKGYWNGVEDYVAKHSMAQFSHGICPDCMRRLYPEHGAGLEQLSAPIPLLLHETEQDIDL